MTKMFSTMILSGLAMISTAYAQSSQPIQAKVPFAFTVQDTTLAAGNYRLTYSNTARILYVRGVEPTSSGAFLLATPESAPGASKESAKLVFQCHDKACYLAQVWQGNIAGDRRLEVLQPPRERKLAVEARVVSITIPAK
jgi:hypothetical protein